MKRLHAPGGYFGLIHICPTKKIYQNSFCVKLEKPLGDIVDFERKPDQIFVIHAKHIIR